MIVYRFSHPKYAHDLSGTGAKLKGGRWNVIGLPLLYTSESVSLSLLEVLANANTLEELKPLYLVEIEIPSNGSLHQLQISQLKKEWWKDFEYCKWIGSEIIRENKVLAIKCPSAIVEMESNYLINSLHSSFKKIRINVIKDFRFDERLFKI